MYQNQWLTATDSLDEPIPVPANCPQEENQEMVRKFHPNRVQARTTRLKTSKPRQSVRG
nr:catalase [Natrialba hulunbeirensis]